MLEQVRVFLKSSGGQIVAIIIALVGLVVVAWAIKGNFGQSEAAAISANRMFIDSVTLKPFEYELRIGETIPVKAPSGGTTGYPAELCYWTEDGKPTDKPTAVLLNATLGKSKPTFCPDCGRLVVGHNPRAEPGMHPPPTNEEYYARHAR